MGTMRGVQLQKSRPTEIPLQRQIIYGQNFFGGTSVAYANNI
jgi:hypothetical protein